jgi:hypothetical protein
MTFGSHVVEHGADEDGVDFHDAEFVDEESRNFFWVPLFCTLEEKGERASSWVDVFGFFDDFLAGECDFVSAFFREDEEPVSEDGLGLVRSLEGLDEGVLLLRV